MAEYQIGATELRQKLTDVIQKVREEKATYIVETFGRPQVVIIELDEYRRLQGQQQEDKPFDELARLAFGMWRDREDIDDEWLTNSREQWNSVWRQQGSDDE